MSRHHRTSASRATGRRRRWRATSWLLVTGAATLTLAGCDGVDDAFVRYSPQVDEAVASLEAGKPHEAFASLRAYLDLGYCDEVDFRVNRTALDKSNAGFDAALALFAIAEEYGARLEDPPPPPPKADDPAPGAPPPQDPQKAEQRKKKLECARLLATAVAADLSQPLDLRARAHYLAGNVELLAGQPAVAVDRYDEALRLVPGLPKGEGVDGLGRDAAFNRAIAVSRMLEEQKNAESESDEDPPPEPDGDDPEEEKEPQKSPPDEPEEKPPGGQQPKDGEEPPPDSKPPEGEQQDQGEGEGKGKEPPSSGNGGGRRPRDPDEKLLDRLDRAPILGLPEPGEQDRAVPRSPVMEDK